MYNNINKTNKLIKFIYTNITIKLSTWDVSNVTNMSVMLSNTIISTANYDALLTGWLGWTGGAPTITLNSSVEFGVTGLTYTLGSDAAARSYLINTLGWTITGDSGI